MRHRASGRHGRYHERRPRWAYLTAPLAVLLAGLLCAGLSGDLTAHAAASSTGRAQAAIAGPAGITLSSTQMSAQIRLAALRDAQARAAAAALAATYTVRPGDSLSQVATRRCPSAADWTGIYAASRARRWTAVDANTLAVGQKLWISCRYVAAALRFAPVPPPPPPAPRITIVASVRPAGYTSTSGYRHRYYRGYAASYASQAPAATASYQGSSSFQLCVIARESGGNAVAVNASSGAGGLYQFLPSTWHALGFSGLPEDAPVATQNAAFAKAYAESGTSPWSAYDGC